MCLGVLPPSSLNARSCFGCACASIARWEGRVRVLRGTLLVLQHERLRDRVRVARWLRVRERSDLGRDGVPATRNDTAAAIVASM